MRRRKADVVVAGHICLDIIPPFSDSGGPQQNLFLPGQLINVGAARLATGGAVSNTGIALYKLGVPTRLIAKVGDDTLGKVTLDMIRSYSEDLVDHMIIDREATSSYSIVINPPGVDRIFLHCSGANDIFSCHDVTRTSLEGAKIFHFGYPPLMRRMYENEGYELQRIFCLAKEVGLTTCLDMARIDSHTEAARADWKQILHSVLPYVDIFLPSIDEITSMMWTHYKQDVADAVVDWTGNDLSQLSDELLGYGCGMVGFKLGSQGLYLRTTTDEARLSRMGNGFSPDPDSGWLQAWRGREILVPCYRVHVEGTTGAGDSTIAGFLAGVLNELTPEAVLHAAVAVGAHCVEALDALSSISSWELVSDRMKSGWERLPITIQLPDWRWADDLTLWIGPNDKRLFYTSMSG